MSWTTVDELAAMAPAPTRGRRTWGPWRFYPSSRVLECERYPIRLDSLADSSVRTLHEEPALEGLHHAV